VQLEQLGAGSDAEHLGLVDGRRPRLAGEHPGGGLQAARAPQLGQAQQRVPRLGERLARDERAAPARLDEPVGHEVLERAPHGGAADAQLVAQPALGREPVAGLEGAAFDLLRDLPVDPVIERLGGVAQRHVSRLSHRRGRGVKHCGRCWSLVVRSGL
jgi:hypothetical protein